LLKKNTVPLLYICLANSTCYYFSVIVGSLESSDNYAKCALYNDQTDCLFHRRTSAWEQLHHSYGIIAREALQNLGTIGNFVGFGYCNSGFISSVQGPMTEYDCQCMCAEASGCDFISVYVSENPNLGFCQLFSGACSSLVSSSYLTYSFYFPWKI